MTDPNQNPDDYNPVVETDYEVGQDNVRPLGLELHNPVFFITAVGIVLAVAFAMIFPERADDALSGLRGYLESTFDWVYMGAANLFVLFCLILLVSPMGRIRLGGESAKPEFTRLAWFGMLFAAGMGIGLMFFGVLEPFYHYASAAGLGDVGGEDSPLGITAEGSEGKAIAMAATIFHWGVHPWAIYAVVAGSLAFFSFNYGLPLTIRSAFFPIFGDRVWGWFGHVIDILAVFATMFGLATSLGLGAEQAATGMAHVWGVPEGNATVVTLILVITAIALVSILLGIHGGVRRLSALNMIMFALLGAFVLIAGSTISILWGSVTSAGHYVANLVQLSNWVGREDTDFMHGWTVFYWAWWISWAPFVGMFIARVSYGRTVREFIFCVLIIPVLATILWMNIMGGLAIDQFLAGIESVSTHILMWDNYDDTMPLFGFLEALPLTALTSSVAILLVVIFFVTSSDSGSLVIDTISAGGKTDAPVVQRSFWAIFEGLVAIALLLSGGIAALQAGAIALGFPFAIVLLLMAGCTLYAMWKEAPNYRPGTA
ncbi:betaine/carnitine transporter, BCCT family [Aquisalimonas asiatica]|uniref:Betaine/carnitine transporter, BCCT family n=1 Tax=Aquisalimonas asiatica TaxID=406100 RepID=A0A1H8PV25_9GAMM|nr:BCCT family transporter [Aquisalimonas asiatica]SEO45393.1 betaine/carnitine transporter, BCCT family [Aquisalimonas asiatica]